MSPRRFDLTPRHVRVLVIVAAVVLMAYCVNSFRQSPEERAESQAWTRLIEAQVTCKDLVRGRLRAPSTATFGTPTPVSLGGNRYRVVGSYDAQNAFGAMLRGRYVCNIRRDDSTWTLVNLTTTR